jgi:hypothetical protein
VPTALAAGIRDSDLRALQRLAGNRATCSAIRDTLAVQRRLGANFPVEAGLSRKQKEVNKQIIKYNDAEKRSRSPDILLNLLGRIQELLLPMVQEESEQAAAIYAEVAGEVINVLSKTASTSWQPPPGVAVREVMELANKRAELQKAKPLLESEDTTDIENEAR